MHTTLGAPKAHSPSLSHCIRNMQRRAPRARAPSWPRPHSATLLQSISQNLLHSQTLAVAYSIHAVRVMLPVRNFASTTGTCLFIILDICRCTMQATCSDFPMAMSSFSFVSFSTALQNALGSIGLDL